jgi:hypothetical protein
VFRHIRSILTFLSRGGAVQLLLKVVRGTSFGRKPVLQPSSDIRCCNICRPMTSILVSSTECDMWTMKIVPWSGAPVTICGLATNQDLMPLKHCAVAQWYITITSTWSRLAALCNVLISTASRTSGNLIINVLFNAEFRVCYPLVRSTNGLFRVDVMITPITYLKTCQNLNKCNSNKELLCFLDFFHRPIF